MKYNKSFIVGIVGLFLVSQSAWAVRVSGNSQGNVLPAPVTVTTPTTSELSGIINAIDYTNGTMNISGATYQFSAMSVHVHSSDRMISGNPLRLQKGMHIKFTVTKEAGKTKEKVSDIWVPDNRQ